jgi:CheY-like chemotaxis protein
MNGILGMTSMALTTELTAEQKEYLETVSYSANSLLSIINDILDFSKAEARKLTLQTAPFDVRECLRESLHTLSANAAEKGLVLQHSIDAAVPDRIVGDSSKVRQILLNLLGNAVKFTPQGSISTIVTVAEQLESGVVLQFAISDTGMGIPREKQSAIFEAFTQVDGSFTREFGGTGLGLAICSQLVALMKGRIWLESEPGHGSQFFFTATFGKQNAIDFPNPPAELPKAQADKLPEARTTHCADRLHVLLAEDNVLNQRIAIKLLEKQGHQVTLAKNGREAVATLQGANWQFDAVLMDVQMPEMDGLEATKAIRRLEGPLGLHIPIIALTAHASETDRDLCLQAGMDRHLTKPIQPQLLLSALHQLVRSKTHRAA